MPLHLSLLQLPARHARFRSLTPYAIHELLWQASTAGDRPDEHTPAERLLYRHDAPTEAQPHHAVLVQTEHEPDWLGPDGPVLHADWVRTRTFDPAATTPGQRFRFRLRANPVVRRGSWHPQAGKHVLVGSHRSAVAERTGTHTLPSREEQLVSWLADKAAAGEGLGFDLAPDSSGAPTCTTTPPHTYRFRKPGGATRTYAGVDFEGLLTVTDPDLLATTVRAGIGRGKTYGFGLLSLAPAQPGARSPARRRAWH